MRQNLNESGFSGALCDSSPVACCMTSCICIEIDPLNGRVLESSQPLRVYPADTRRTRSYIIRPIQTPVDSCWMGARRGRLAGQPLTPLHHRTVRACVQKAPSLWQLCIPVLKLASPPHTIEPWSSKVDRERCAGLMQVHTFQPLLAPHHAYLFSFVPSVILVPSLRYPNLLRFFAGLGSASHAASDTISQFRGKGCPFWAIAGLCRPTL